MSSQIPNDLVNRIPENIPVNVEEAALLVNNVVSVAMGVLSNPQFGAGPSNSEGSGGSLSHRDLDEKDIEARALLLMQGDTTEWKKARILITIRAIPSGERKDVVQRALLLIHGNMSTSGITNILGTIQKIPSEEWQNVIQQASPLMQGIMDGDFKAWILDAIRQTPSEERQDVIQRALPLMQGDIKGSTKADILNAIRQIPSAERQDVIQQALPLMQNIKGSNKDEILNAIRQIPSEERENVIQQALPLMRGDMPGDEKGMILKAIREIPSEERENVMQQALPLMQGDMKGMGKIAILDAIWAILSEERKNVILRALPLMRDNMSGWKKANILDAIRMIPVAERNPRAARALEQIQLDFPPEQQVVDLETYQDRVRQLLETPLNEAFLPMRQDNAMAAAAAAAAGHAVINVHAGSRDSRTAQTLQLLRQSQRITLEEIQTALKACIKYLEDHECNKALTVLIRPEDSHDYGPFFKPFIIDGMKTSGQEVIGRLWQFIHHLSPEQEKEAALHSMIISLNECVNENGERICDPGKMQHLFIAVLQGRLKGVRIDDSIEIPEAPLAQNAPAALLSISVEAAAEMFFHVAANREIDNLQALLQAATLFCNDNPSVDPELFITEIKNYARESGIE